MSKNLYKGLERDGLELLKKYAKQELAKKKYLDFLEYVHPGFKRNKLNRFLSIKIDKLIREGNKRYMIFTPPRMGKSLTITKSLGAYFLMHNPNKEVMITSYGADLSVEFGKANRDIFQFNAPELFNLKIDDRKKGVVTWEVDKHMGVCRATSIMGAVPGKGADLLIVDDPIKNMQEVAKVEERDKLYEHYLSNFNARLHDNASVVIILTRWHDDDLAGRLLAETQKLKDLGEPYREWEVFSIPAIAEDDGNDLLGRQPGEVIWPERYPLVYMEEVRAMVGRKIWASLYQQNPIVESGEIFNSEDFQRYHSLPKDFDIVLQSWDTNFKNVIGADYVVGQVWGKKDNKFYMLYQIRGRFSFNETKQLIVATKQKFPKISATLIEESANGYAIIQELESTIPGIIPIVAKGSKESRASAVTPYIEAHNVFLPNDSTGDMIVDECTRFPYGKNDDQVDALTQALNYFRDTDRRIKTYNKAILGL